MATMTSTFLSVEEIGQCRTGPNNDIDLQAVYGGRISSQKQKGLKVNPVYSENQPGSPASAPDINGNMDTVHVVTYETFPRMKDKAYSDGTDDFIITPAEMPDDPRNPLTNGHIQTGSFKNGSVKNGSVKNGSIKNGFKFQNGKVHKSDDDDVGVDANRNKLMHTKSANAFYVTNNNHSNAVEKNGLSKKSIVKSQSETTKRSSNVPVLLGPRDQSDSQLISERFSDVSLDVTPSEVPSFNNRTLSQTDTLSVPKALRVTENLRPLQTAETSQSSFKTIDNRDDEARVSEEVKVRENEQMHNDINILGLETNSVDVIIEDRIDADASKLDCDAALIESLVQGKPETNNYYLLAYENEGFVHSENDNICDVPESDSGCVRPSQVKNIPEVGSSNVPVKLSHIKSETSLNGRNPLLRQKKVEIDHSHEHVGVSNEHTEPKHRVAEGNNENIPENNVTQVQDENDVTAIESSIVADGKYLGNVPTRVTNNGYFDSVSQSSIKSNGHLISEAELASDSDDDDILNSSGKSSKTEILTEAIVHNHREEEEDSMTIQRMSAVVTRTERTSTPAATRSRAMIGQGYQSDNVCHSLTMGSDDWPDVDTLVRPDDENDYDHCGAGEDVVSAHGHNGHSSVHSSDGGSQTGRHARSVSDTLQSGSESSSYNNSMSCRENRPKMYKKKANNVKANSKVVGNGSNGNDGSTRTLKSILTNSGSISQCSCLDNCVHNRQSDSESEIHELKSVKFSQDTVFNENKRSKYKQERVGHINLREIYRGKIVSDSAMAKLNPIYSEDESKPGDIGAQLTDDEKLAHDLQQAINLAPDKRDALNQPSYMEKYLILKAHGLKPEDSDIEKLPEWMEKPVYDRLIQRTIAKERRKCCIKWIFVILTVLVITGIAVVLGMYAKKGL